MNNRQVLITGANSGIGRATAEALAAKGGSLILACRNKTKGEAVQQEIADLTKDYGKSPCPSS
jgi:NAD(P)-dependent dehydrogenase (short-subunit alcohol dehydrogenase family)